MFRVSLKAIGFLPTLVLLSFHSTVAHADGEPRADGGGKAMERPRIGAFKFSDAIVTPELKARYLDDMEDCLHQIEAAAGSSFDPKFSMKIDLLEVVSPDSLVSGGSASDVNVTVSGRPDKGTACHEAFHVFQLKLPNGLPHTSDGKTSILFEAVPQIMAILGARDCLVGREGRGALAYDHCHPISWKDLPTLRESATRERRLALQMGLTDVSYWDRLLSRVPEDRLNQPSAYYSSIPLGYALYSNLESCHAGKLIRALVAAWKDASATTGAFDSFQTFTPLLIERIERYSGRECRISVEEVARRLIFE